MVHAQSKEILDLFTEELKKVWKKKQSMIDYCLKENYDEVAFLPSGKLFATEKRKIETSFCFGYHTDNSGEDYENAHKAMLGFSKSEQAFYDANMEAYERELKSLKNDGKEYEWQCAKLILKEHYSGSNIVEWGVLTSATYDGIHYWQTGELPKGVMEVTDADLKAIVSTVETSKAKFEKRLKAYIKRYGTSKLKTWTYWLDE